MRLHYHPVSPYARKALVALLHRGDTFERRLLDIRGGDLRTEAYRKLSPFGKMPVLETEDGPLIESTSIIEWLEERGPRVLLPASCAREARRWDRIGDHYLIEPQSEIWFRPDTAAAAEARVTVPIAWALFEEQLAGRDFVCGATFTLGDIGAAIATGYLEGLDVVPPPAIKAWRKRCFAVPAMAEALDEARPSLVRMLEARRR